MLNVVSFSAWTLSSASDMQENHSIEQLQKLIAIDHDQDITGHYIDFMSFQSIANCDLVCLQLFCFSSS